MDQIDYRSKIFDIMRQPILLIDPHYSIVDVNSAACISMNLARDEVVGQPCFKVTHRTERPCWLEKMSCPVQFVLKHQKQTSAIHKHFLAGKIVFEEIVASPLFNNEGEIKFVIKELRDVTELINLKEISEYLENEIRTLRGILPICVSCKKIRDNKGYWQEVEVYIRDHTDANFSHSYCPDCAERAMQEIRTYQDSKSI